jgi:hypothetical protein
MPPGRPAALRVGPWIVREGKKGNIPSEELGIAFAGFGFGNEELTKVYLLFGVGSA